jgi:hypothetical protein
MENEAVHYEYLRDPANKLRVVTFAWRRTVDAIEYAFAVNRVVSPPGHPDVTISTKEQRFYDPHNREQARLTTTRRLNSKRRRRLILKHPDNPVLGAIVADFDCLSSLPQTSSVPSVRIAVISGVLTRIKRAELKHKIIGDGAEVSQVLFGGSRSKRNKGPHDRNCRCGVQDVEGPKQD